VRRLGLVGGGLIALASPAWAQQAAPAAPSDSSSAMPGMDMASMESALGPYGMARDASGTSWQPDASNQEGVGFQAGGWMVMAHGYANGVYDDQSGPRGADKAFVEGMIMGMAQHSLGEGNELELRAMLSPDPFMGPGGYPLLLGTGETADGKTPLVDRQHPHNLIMELSATVSHQVGVHDSVYVYAGLPGEPALGPPTFMHRQSGMDDPEAPITHHWLDSTHITNGVITTGWEHDNIKVEVSAFNGREPDQYRFQINTPTLDSVAARLSWNPGPSWSVQTSWGHLTSPEQLEPTVNEDRWTASAIYTLPLGRTSWWSTTAAVGVKRESYGQTLNGFLLESALKPSDAWTIFSRAELEQNNELLSLDTPPPPIPAPTTAYAVGKIGIGAIHDWRVAPHLKFGVGALYDWIFVPVPLRVAYGDDPHGTMAFVRLKLD
jgi:hypothetical protein